MGFRDMFSKFSPGKKGWSRGFTLVEMMIALAIAGLLGVVIVTSVIYSARSYASMVNYIDLDQKSRVALDTIVLDVRGAVRVVSCVSNQTTASLTVELVGGDEVSYVYDRAARTLSREAGGVERVLLRECDNLEFHMFQRTSLTDSNNKFHPSGAAHCKLIEVNWICSRKILGRTWNTESVQTARIVLRNQN
ncbi:MAG: PilW family protein [Limisphaerales bacterium]